MMAKTEKKVARRGAPNPAFMKAMKPSEALSKIVGNKPLPRTEITKKLWEYIKTNSLQDANNKRNINADENLLAVFDGKKQVSMFEMTKLVNKHLS
jgi:chromatin remodeling complex protein RSC6